MVGDGVEGAGRLCDVNGAARRHGAVGDSWQVMREGVGAGPARAEARRAPLCGRSASCRSGYSRYSSASTLPECCRCPSAGSRVGKIIEWADHPLTPEAVCPALIEPCRRRGRLSRVFSSVRGRQVSMAKCIDLCVSLARCAEGRQCRPGPLYSCSK